MLQFSLKTCDFRKNIHLLKTLNNNRHVFVPITAPLVQRPILHYRDPCGSGGISAKSKHQISYTPYKPVTYTCHDEKNMKLNRPMSPHLTIYAPTLPAMTSIVQRGTGCILVSYALLMAAGSLFLSNGVETYVSMIQSLNFSRPFIFIIKICLGAPFVYHYFNGIRFCMWNAGKWLAIKDVYESARKSFVATAIVTAIFALLVVRLAPVIIPPPPLAYHYEIIEIDARFAPQPEHHQDIDSTTDVSKVKL